MKLTKTKFQLLICFIVLFVSCTMTTTKTKDPAFSVMGKVEKELASVISSENINLNGKEITTNNKTSSELEVSITNGKNIPADDEARKALGKLIATIIKENLKDKTEFDTYKVLFVTKIEEGAMTKRNWVGNVFNSAEL